MTLTKLVIGVVIAGLILTIIQRTSGGRKLIPNPFLSFLQNAVGVLFIFSGGVKAVDPLGTAYKMEQYFAEFESTFSGTAFDFMASWFPVLAEYAIGFSVFMIVLEIVLGIMLMVGIAKRFTSWVFFLMLVFFTILTGFTYLTGYVPEGVNFFQFGQWAAYEATNMKVTDCGCFGDFLKLEPYVSFMKDIVLLIPGLYFLFAAKSFHTLTSGNLRAITVGVGAVLTLATIYFFGYSVGVRLILFVLGIIAVQYLPLKASVWGSTAVVFLYCLSNYVTDIPEVDFRPFREGANIAERKALEEEAENNVKVLAYKMTNKSSGEVVELPFDDYLAQYQNYPSEEWDLDQIKSEPTVERTKVSDFDISDLQGSELTSAILAEEGPSLMLVAYRLYGTESQTTSMVPDSIFVADTIVVDTGVVLSPRLLRVDQNEVITKVYDWDPDYVEQWQGQLKETVAAAKEAGVKVYGVTAYSDPGRIKDFQEAIDLDIPFFIADDILLKTIVRSNPGPVLWQAGSILSKWHYKNVAPYTEMQSLLGGN